MEIAYHIWIIAVICSVLDVVGTVACSVKFPQTPYNAPKIQLQSFYNEREIKGQFLISFLNRNADFPNEVLTSCIYLILQHLIFFETNYPELVSDSAFVRLQF